MIRDQSNCIRRSIVLIVFVLISVAVIFPQQGLIKNEFLAIKPGISTKQDVDGAFNHPNVVNFSTRIVMTSRLIIVDYARGDCTLSAWSFPRLTVEEVTIFPRGRKRLRLTDVILDKGRFEVRNDSHLLTVTEYFNNEAGVSIEYDNKLRRVESIRIRPTAEMASQYQCPNKL